jgi:hypothetical protein
MKYSWYLVAILVLVSSIASAEGTFNYIPNLTQHYNQQRAEPQQVASTSSGSRNYTAEIRAYCDADWAPDYSMVEHCITQQGEGADLVSRLIGRIRSGSKEETIMIKCGNEWLYTAKPDFTMVAYCYNQSKEALDRLRR